MGFRLDGFVGTNSMADGNQQGALARFGRDGSLVVQESHGKYYEQLMRGNIYIAAVATGGIALIISAAGGGHPTLWNPLGSGYNVEVIALELTWISGAVAPTALYWMITQPSGSAAATGGPIATFTNVLPVNALVGGPTDTDIRWAPAVNTFTAAPAFYSGTGIGLGTGAPTVNPDIIRCDYDGRLGMSPGAALSLCSQAATTTALFGVSIYYIKNKV